MGPISKRNENLDPLIYLSKDLSTPKQSLVPIHDRYNIQSNPLNDLVKLSSQAAA